MEYRLTEHAELEMQRRQVPSEWIESVMHAPEQIVTGFGGRKVYQGRVSADDKTYLLRLIVEDWHTPPVVVTVYRTSKIEKYWEQT
ncbi:MAG: DUF4258 domain-containing protein [Thiobacillus sp.]|nr:DUF4258 domain-containing protein [Thiobacillus sp.]MDP2978256.1 DUF4258 domain-containing protein [Thiobacillus sp.]